MDLFVCKILGWLSLNKSKEKFCDTKNYSSTSTKVIASIEVQDNETGRTLDYRTKSNSTGPSVILESYANTSRYREMAVFGCHEARGQGSIVRYTSTKI